MLNKAPPVRNRLIDMTGRYDGAGIPDSQAPGPWVPDAVIPIPALFLALPPLLLGYGGIRSIAYPGGCAGGCPPDMLTTLAEAVERCEDSAEGPEAPGNQRQILGIR